MRDTREFRYRIQDGRRKFYCDHFGNILPAWDAPDVQKRAYQKYTRSYDWYIQWVPLRARPERPTCFLEVVL